MSSGRSRRAAAPQPVPIDAENFGDLNRLFAAVLPEDENGKPAKDSWVSKKLTPILESRWGFKGRLTKTAGRRLANGLELTMAGTHEIPSAEAIHVGAQLTRAALEFDGYLAPMAPNVGGRPRESAWDVLAQLVEFLLARQPSGKRRMSELTVSRFVQRMFLEASAALRKVAPSTKPYPSADRKPSARRTKEKSSFDRILERSRASAREVAPIAFAQDPISLLIARR